MNSDLPKVLCQVAGRPMIEFVVDAADRAGIEEKVVVVGYEADLVKATLARRNDPKLFFAEQHEQLGTGHAVQMCEPYLRERSGVTLVVAGDSPLIQPASLTRLIEHFQSTRPALLLGTLKKDDPTGLGRIVRDEQGHFVGIVEHKDASETERQICEVNMSTYLFDNAALLWALGQLDNKNAQGEYYLTDCAKLLSAAGRPVEALPVLQPCEALSINNPAELEIVDQTMRTMGYA